MIKISINKSREVNPILSKKSAFISCPYVPEIVEYLRNLSFRHYEATTKIWEIQEKDLRDFCIRFGQSNGPIEVTDDYIEEKQENYNITIPENYNFLLPLYQHQKDGILFGLNHPNFLLGDEMGLGKTMQSLYISDIECHTGKVLVIVCSATLKYNWKEEIKKTLGQDARVLGTREKYRKKWDDYITYEGNGQDKYDDLCNLDNISEKYIITNRETLTLLKTKKGRGYIYTIAEKIEELCKSGKIEAIIIDEFHNGLRSIKGQASKAILKIASPKYRIAMTGTPVLNGPLDIYVMMRWLNIIPESYSFYTFKETFADLDAFGNPISYKNLPQLSELLRNNMLRRERKDCLDLPKRIFIDEYVEMTVKQKNLYRIIQQGLWDELNKMIFSPEPLSRLIELRKVTGLPNLIDENLGLEDNAKMQRLLELVASIVEGGHKVVIYSNWVSVTNQMKELLKDYNPAYIIGDVAQDKRLDECKKLNTDPNCKVLIGDMAMANGLTMTGANYFIFYDEPWTKGIYDQISDRIYRIGQEQECFVYNLMCKNTIDEGVHQLVQGKGELASFVVDGRIDKSSHKNLLQALISIGSPTKLKY